MTRLMTQVITSLLWLLDADMFTIPQLYKVKVCQCLNTEKLKLKLKQVANISTILRPVVCGNLRDVCFTGLNDDFK